MWHFALFISKIFAWFFIIFVFCWISPSYPSFLPHSTLLDIIFVITNYSYRTHFLDHKSGAGLWVSNMDVLGATYQCQWRTPENYIKITVWWAVSSQSSTWLEKAFSISFIMSLLSVGMWFCWAQSFRAREMVSGEKQLRWFLSFHAIYFPSQLGAFLCCFLSWKHLIPALENFIIQTHT